MVKKRSVVDDNHDVGDDDDDGDGDDMDKIYSKEGQWMMRIRGGQELREYLMCPDDVSVCFPLFPKTPRS